MTYFMQGLWEVMKFEASTDQNKNYIKHTTLVLLGDEYCCF